MACLARDSQEVWLLLSGVLFWAGTHHGAPLKSNSLSAPGHPTPPQHWANTHRPEQTVKIMTIPGREASQATILEGGPLDRWES